MITPQSPAHGSGTALDALIDAAAGILAADSLEETLLIAPDYTKALELKSRIAAQTAAN